MKTKNILIISFFLLSQNVQLIGQVYEEMVRINIDSIHQFINSMNGTKEIDGINKLALAYCRDFPDSCIEYATMAKTMSEELNYNKGIADANLYLGYAFLYQDSIKNAIINFLDAIRIYEELEASIEMGFTLRMLQAVNMLTAYHSRIAAMGGDVKPMVNILLRRQRHAEAGTSMGKRAIALVQSDESIMAENEREQQKAETLKEASNIFGLAGKDCLFQKTCTDEYLDLISDQEQLRRQYGTVDVAPPSSSVTATITSILKYAATDPRSSHKLFADADKLAKKYKVSEKRLWYVKVNAFSESKQWAVLRNLADSRAKSPIGMKPFALAVIKGKQGEAEIMHYVNRMQGQSDGEDRYELFCEAGLWRKAVDEAVKLGDGRRIAHVRSVCNSIEIQSLCDKYV